MLLNLLVFYLISFIGWQVAKKIHIPAPVILGPVVAVGITNLLGCNLIVTEYLQPILSLILGIILGSRFSLDFKGLVKDVLLVSFWMVLVGNLTGFLLNLVGVERATAMFSAMPGGLAELSLMSMTMGADTFQVALLQTTRLVSVLFIIPFIVKKVHSYEVEQGLEDGTSGEVQMTLRESGDESFNESEKETGTWKDLASIVVLASVIAYLLGLINMAAIQLLGGIIATVIYTRYKDVKIEIHNTVQDVTQVGIGGLIGLNITIESVMAISGMVLPIIILNVVLIGSGLILGFLLRRMHNWDLTTCLLATAPAGITPMSLLALELEADFSLVVLFQIVRIITVIFVTPIQGKLFY
jgi:membrane AbrB-like protein